MVYSEENLRQNTLAMVPVILSAILPFNIFTTCAQNNCHRSLVCNANKTIESTRRQNSEQGVPNKARQKSPSIYFRLSYQVHYPNPNEESPRLPIKWATSLAQDNEV